jgi:hypothetical protein
LGYDVEDWKVLPLVDKTALVGKTKNSIILAIGHNDTYQHMKTLEFDVSSSLHSEVLKIWDSNQSRARNLVLVVLGPKGNRLDKTLHP